MRLKLLSLFMFLLPAVLLADLQTNGKKLAEEYVAALKAADVKAVSKHLPTLPVIAKMMKKKPAEVKDQHKKMNARFKENFKGVFKNARANAVDFKQLKIKKQKTEAIPNAMPGMVYITILGDYLGREVKLSVVAIEQNSKLYLVDIDRKHAVFDTYDDEKKKDEKK